MMTENYFAVGVPGVRVTVATSGTATSKTTATVAVTSVPATLVALTVRLTVAGVVTETVTSLPLGVSVASVSSEVYVMPVRAVGNAVRSTTAPEASSAARTTGTFWVVS